MVITGETHCFNGFIYILQSSYFRNIFILAKTFEIEAILSFKLTRNLTKESVETLSLKATLTLREKCRKTFKELFLVDIFLYSVRIQEYADQK